MPVGHQKHRGVSVAPTVFPSCRHQPLDLGLCEVLAGPQGAVGWSFRPDCSIYSSWRDKFEVRVDHAFGAFPIADCSYGLLYEQPCSDPSVDETWPCCPHNFKTATTVRCVANSLANFSLMPASYRTRYVRSYKAAYCSFQTCLNIMQPLIGHGLRLRAALARSWLMAGCATPRYAGQAGWWGAA